MPTTAPDLTGGCLCGAVRFRLTAKPFDAGWCHCRTCQLNSGSPAMVFAAVPFPDYRFERGEDRVGTVRSSSFGHRAFCRDCGTPLYMRVDYEPDTVDFSVATLDRPEDVSPEFHIFYSSRISWAEPLDRLPRHDRSRPGSGGPA